MIKITKELAKELSQLKGIGHFWEFGAVVGDDKLILYYDKEEIYLTHISEFEIDGFLMRLKNHD